jgi:hypothetical protein
MQLLLQYARLRGPEGKLLVASSDGLSTAVWSGAKSGSSDIQLQTQVPVRPCNHQCAFVPLVVSVCVCVRVLRFSVLFPKTPNYWACFSFLVLVFETNSGLQY